MNPAFSVIFLTTLAGVGQGLFLALYTGQVYSVIEVVPPQDESTFYGLGSLVALGFLAAGLLASFFHLGHPERAWRSAAMWRTSWLSREVIALPAFMGCLAVYGAIHGFGWDQHLVTFGTIKITTSLVVGLITTVACVVLFICTAMIYACIKFIQEWASPLTLVYYLSIGSTTGLTFATAYSAFIEKELTVFFALWAIIFATVAMGFRLITFIRNARIKYKSSTKTAIGVRHPVIDQKAQGCMGGSFNTREFFHGKSLSFLKNIRWISFLLVFILPIILLIIVFNNPSIEVSFLAFGVQFIGIIADRWLFFAQANHPQNIYYQTIS